MPSSSDIASTPPGAAQKPSVCFRNSHPESAGNNDWVIDLSGTSDHDPASPTADSPMVAAYKQNGEEWRQRFIEWLGKANIANPIESWWSFACTAKNLLSSPLGNRFLQVMALNSIIRAAQFRNLFVVGATQGQYLALKSCIPDWVKLEEPTSKSKKTTPHLWFSRLRNAFMALRLLVQVIVGRWNMRGLRPHNPDLWLFTYYGGRHKPKSDAFFGPLKELLGQTAPEVRVAFTGFSHIQLSPLCRHLRDTAPHEHWPIYLELRTVDFAAAALRAIRLTRRSYRDLFRLPPLGAGLPDTAHLLEEALAHDATSGSMLHHILIFRATRRLAKRQHRGAIIYPFEAKALERMLIAGIRGSAGTWEISGYQHTSITPRHLTFFLADGEAAAIPLPDRVLTVGDITKRFLEDKCNYPNGLFRTACTLRQTLPNESTEPREPSTPPRLLLALSSSREELLLGVRFMKSLLDKQPGLFRLGIRPHPEFPLTLLPDSLAAWVAEQADDLSRTELGDNLDWCDAVGYVSSTVALEGLMAGKGAFQFSIGDPVEPDPVLGSCPNHWRVANGERFLHALREFTRTEPVQRCANAQAARHYLTDYFAPITADALRNFLPTRLRETGDNPTSTQAAGPRSDC